MKTLFIGFTLLSSLCSYGNVLKDNMLNGTREENFQKCLEYMSTDISPRQAKKECKKHSLFNFLDNPNFDRCYEIRSQSIALNYVVRDCVTRTLTFNYVNNPDFDRCLEKTVFIDNKLPYYAMDKCKNEQQIATGQAVKSVKETFTIGLATCSEAGNSTFSDNPNLSCEQKAIENAKNKASSSCAFLKDNISILDANLKSTKMKHVDCSDLACAAEITVRCEVYDLFPENNSITKSLKNHLDT